MDRILFCGKFDVRHNQGAVVLHISANIHIFGTVIGLSIFSGQGFSEMFNSRGSRKTGTQR